MRADYRRARRTQLERRAGTRSRLLEATIQSLAEVGWSATSTIEVARRAGVSRGAQQHHYRTKIELVSAAIEHLVERHRGDFEQAFAELPADRRNAEGAIDLLWSIFQGPTVTALLELEVAARTDERLRIRVANINDRIATVTIETFERLFPGTLHREASSVLLRALLALLTGLALQNGLDHDRDGHHAAVLTQLKAIGTQLIPMAPPDESRSPQQ